MLHSTIFNTKAEEKRGKDHREKSRRDKKRKGAQRQAKGQGQDRGNELKK